MSRRPTACGLWYGSGTNNRSWCPGSKPLDCVQGIPRHPSPCEISINIREPGICISILWYRKFSIQLFCGESGACSRGSKAVCSTSLRAREHETFTQPGTTAAACCWDAHSPRKWSRASNEPGEQTIFVERIHCSILQPDTGRYGILPRFAILVFLGSLTKYLYTSFEVHRSKSIFYIVCHASFNNDNYSRLLLFCSGAV